MESIEWRLCGVWLLAVLLIMLVGFTVLGILIHNRGGNDASANASGVSTRR